MAKRKNVPVKELDETTELRNRLEETEETLQAIRQYLVDAFVIDRGDLKQVVTVEEAGFPYRMMVEAMNEGAVTLIPDGTILYANPYFCKMAQREGEKLIGLRFQDLILPAEQEAFLQLLDGAGQNGMRGEFCLQDGKGDCLPVQLSAYELSTNEVSSISIIVTDLTERVQAERKIRSLASALTRAEQEERHRISQVLHDDLQQRLFAIKAQLSMLAFEKEENILPEMRSTLEQVQRDLSSAVSITRSLSIDLSPSVLQGEGLAEAILWLASKMEEQFGLQVELESKESLSQMEDHMRVLLFRAVRESLFNIVKHSQTRHATVGLGQANGCIYLTVHDEGVGFDVESVMHNSSAAHGLLTIQNRLSLMGGSMEVTSKIEEGTHVKIEVPVQANS